MWGDSWGSSRLYVVVLTDLPGSKHVEGQEYAILNLEHGGDMRGFHGPFRYMAISEEVPATPSDIIHPNPPPLAQLKKKPGFSPLVNQPSAAQQHRAQHAQFCRFYKWGQFICFIIAPGASSDDPWRPASASSDGPRVVTRAALSIHKARVQRMSCV